MRFRSMLMAGMVVIGTPFLGQATAFADPCPTFSSGGASETGCQILITFNADGSVTTSQGSSPTPYVTEDVSVGVINNSSNTITQIPLSSSVYNIFAFEVPNTDGIDIYVSGAPAGSNPDTTQYGGPNGYFTGINPAQNSGYVNFANGGIASGGSDYFSLESPVAYNQLSPTVPEPASVALLGVALAGLGAVRRRKQVE